MNKLQKKTKCGFTLVEIMIVVAIIGLLAAIAIPSFIKSRETSQANACVNNLRQIESAKEQYALAEGLATNGTMTTANLTDYIKGDSWTNCPGNGTYTLGDVSTQPSCSLGDPHILPQ